MLEGNHDRCSALRSSGHMLPTNFVASSRSSLNTGRIVLQENVDGDTATVKVSYTKELPRVPAQNVETAVELVKENGLWKIAGGI
jgi:hypothetical protein